MTALQPIRIRNLDHVNLTVSDLSASIRFYQALFGFEVVEWGPEGDAVPWAILRTGDALLCLHEHPALPRGPSYPEPAAQQEVRHFALRTTDGARFEDVARVHGTPLLFGGPVRWPHSTSFYVTDPSGHQIEVVSWNDDVISFDPLPGS